DRVHGRMLLRNFVLGEMVDNVAAVNRCENQEADAGEMFHPQQCFITEFAMTERNGPTQAREPCADAQRYTAYARKLSRPIGGNPFAGNELGSNDNPENQDAEVSEHAHESGHERGTGIKVFPELFLELMGARTEIDRSFF